MCGPFWPVSEHIEPGLDLHQVCGEAVHLGPTGSVGGDRDDTAIALGLPVHHQQIGDGIVRCLLARRGIAQHRKCRWLRLAREGGPLGAVPADAAVLLHGVEELAGATIAAGRTGCPAPWLLERMAQRYLDGLAEYNSYKHGLRVLTGSNTLTIGLESSPGGPGEGIVEQFHSPDSLTFLEFEKTPEGDKKVYEVTKHINPSASIFYVSKMSQMAETIRRTRLYHYDGTPVTELCSFLSLDRQQVLQSEMERQLQIRREL